MLINGISAAILLLLLWGRSLAKKNLRAHIRVVSVAMLLDLLLVLYLAVAREALTKVNLSMPWLLTVHVSLALGVLLFYVLVTHAGWNLLKGRESYRKRLRFLDRVIVPTRILVLVTSTALFLFPSP